MKIILPRNIANGLVLGIASSLLIAVVAWAGFTGPDRTTTKTVREPDEDQWFCNRSGSPTCWFAKGVNPCPSAGGSHPSKTAQQNVCGWIADSCGCNEGFSEQTTTLPPATVSGSEVCGTPGNNGWCRAGPALSLSANEPVAGQVIKSIEGNPGGVLCDPADSSSISCSWSGGGQGSFTVEFWAVSSLGDTSEKSFADWKLDSIAPTINLSVPGGSGWNRGGSYAVSISGADSTSGVAAAEISVDGGAWSSSAQVSGDGIHSISGRVIDGAGNQSTQSGEIKIDGTPPNVEAELAGTLGQGGWYVSGVTISASASDALSGVARVQVSLNGGAWRDAPLVVSADGTHSLRVRASDHAGNEATASGPTIKVDAHPPQSVFIDPPNGSVTWVSGLVELYGTSVDFASGLQGVEISFDNGSSWEAIELRGMEWSASWDTTGLPGGDYPVLARARDQAGHLESTARVTLRIDSTAPLVDIPDSWLVSEAAPVTVREDQIGLAGARFEVADGILVDEFDPDSIPPVIQWDGVMPDGSLAAPGRYLVRVTAWDLAGNQGQDVGYVIVPQTGQPADDPPDRLVGVQSEANTSGSGEASAGTQPTVMQATIFAPLTFDVWLWPALAWLGLMGTIGFAKLLDPRPAALRGLRKDLAHIRKVLEE